MDKTKLIRWSGLAAILGGVLTIPPAFSFQPPWNWLGQMGSLLLVFGIIGIYAVQVEESGLAGFLGFVLAVAASVFLAGSGSELFGVPLWMLGSLLGAVGFVLLAIGMFASDKFPRWVAWMLIAAVVVGVPSLFIPSLQSLLGILGSVAAALGLAGAGYTLWSSKAK